MEALVSAGLLSAARMLHSGQPVQAERLVRDALAAGMEHAPDPWQLLATSLLARTVRTRRGKPSCS